MINNTLKNICLIIFALIGPITLPAGGIQKSLNQFKFHENNHEIILGSDISLYTSPEMDAKKLLLLEKGTSISILRKWKVNKKRKSDNNVV